MFLSRRLVLLAPLGLAACGDDGPPRVYGPIRYDYLTPLQLNVASVDMADLPPPGGLDELSPVPIGPAVRQMLQDRLSAAGSSGRAVVTVEDARVARSSGGLDGAVAVRLDIVAADGKPAGFAEARVARRLDGVGRNLRPAIYDMTKQMLDDMNVEFEFQIRRSLRDYLQTTTTAPTPAPVEKQDLAPPAS